MPNFNTLTFRQCIVRGQADQIAQKKQSKSNAPKAVKALAMRLFTIIAWPLNRVPNYRKWSAKSDQSQIILRAIGWSFLLLCNYRYGNEANFFFEIEITRDFPLDIISIKWVVGVGSVRFRHLILLNTHHSRLFGVINIKICIYTLA